jgi:hypothetical protein
MTTPDEKLKPLPTVNRIIMMKDIVEKNGKTIEENNLAKPRKFKVGDSVTFTINTTITKVGRDCDGTVLYGADYIGNNWGEDCFVELIKGGEL